MIENGKWVGSFRRKTPVWKVAASTVETRLAAVRHYFPLAAECPKQDLEYVHQLRVSTRRMVAALDLYSEFLPQKPTRRLRRCLKQIRRAAGNARDCDVLLIRHEDSDGDRRAQRFIASVRRKRRDAQTPICREFHSTQDKGGFDTLANNLLAQIRAVHAAETRPRFGPWARRKLKTVVSDFFDAQPRHFDDLEGLHKFRIAGKRLRYTIELLSSAFPRQLQEKLYPVIEEMQEALGDINDHAVALRRFGEWREASTDRLERKHFKRLKRREKKALTSALDQFAIWWTPKRARKLRKQFRRLTTTT